MSICKTLMNHIKQRTHQSKGCVTFLYIKIRISLIKLKTWKFSFILFYSKIKFLSKHNLKNWIPYQEWENVFDFLEHNELDTWLNLPQKTVLKKQLPLQSIAGKSKTFPERAQNLNEDENPEMKAEYKSQLSPCWNCYYRGKWSLISMALQKAVDLT